VDAPSRSDELLERVWRSHQADFLAFAMKLSVTKPALSEQTGITDCLRRFQVSTAEARRRLIEYPPFLAWLKRSLASDQADDDLAAGLGELKRLIHEFDECGGKPRLTVPGTGVGIARFDVDSLIVQGALPEYKFPVESRQTEFDETVAYPFSFFQEVVSLALERIRRALPAAHVEFPKFVKLIVDMIDSDYTSYSGYQHVGVIFVSTDNSPLVALEEYLIHEFGHQILYNVTELDPIVIDDDDNLYKLPWSGRQRNLYGYFHAFYIYTFLAHYLGRVTGRSRREQRRISDRLAHIRKGLERAAVELEALGKFTPRGKQLFDNVRNSYSNNASL
jgi:hypothetical protein